MNNDSPHPVLERNLSFDDRIDILFAEIELAVRWERPSILFAIYRSEAVREQVNGKLAEALGEIGQKSYYIKTDCDSEFNFLTQISQLPDISETVLFIEGFNWACGAEGMHVFAEFNKHREYFIDNNIRAIFWLFEDEVSEFASNATECWILRHRVVEFIEDLSPAQDLERSVETVWQRTDDSLTEEGLPGCSVQEVLDLPEGEKASASHANALLILGILFWRKGNPRRALKFLNTAGEMATQLADHALQAQCQNALALVHSDLGNTDQAVAAYQQAIVLAPESDALWNNLGQLLARSERNEEAIAAFKQALVRDPQDFLSWNGLGQMHARLGLYQNAISAFQKALETSPAYAPAWLGIGLACQESGQLEPAEAALQRALVLDDHLVEAWVNLGKCLALQNRDNRAVEAYGKALEINPQNLEAWDHLGRLHLQRQDYEASVAGFQKAISIDPNFSEAYLGMAYALFEKGDFKTSAVIYEKAITLFEDPETRAVLWNRLGDTYVHLKEYEKAIAAYRQSDELVKECQEPEPAERQEDAASQTLHCSEMENEQNDPAEERGETMNESTRVFDSRSAREWNELGNTYLKSGAYNEAIAAYTKAIDLAPDASWPYIQNLAQVHYQKGKLRGQRAGDKEQDPDVWEEEDESLSATLFGTDSIPTPERHDSQSEEEQPGVAQRDPLDAAHTPAPSGCCSEEQAVLSESLRESPLSPEEPEPVVVEVPDGSASDWNELGNAYLKDRNFDAAIEAYKKAIELDPRDGQPYSNLGFIYYHLGKFQVAILLYKKSIDLLNSQQDKAISWNRLGDAYRRIGDYKNAMTAYQTSSEIVPTASPVMARARGALLETAFAG